MTTTATDFIAFWTSAAIRSSDSNATNILNEAILELITDPYLLRSIDDLQELKDDEPDQLQAQDHTIGLARLDRADAGIRQAHELGSCRL